MSENEQQIQKPGRLKRFWNLIKNNANSIVSFKLSVFYVLMFLAVGSPDIFSGINIDNRWVGAIIFGVYLVVSFMVCLFTRWKWKRKISVWVQTNLLFIFSILYYLRLNSESFDLAGIGFGSNAILIVLGIFGFIVNRRLFRRSFLREWLLIGEVVLISLTTFSIINVFQFTQSTNLDNPLLGGVVELPQLVWIGFAAISLAVISGLNTGTTEKKKVVLFGVGFSFIFFQIMMLLNFLNLTYWYKTLLFLVFWDFVHSSSRAIVLEESSINYYPKLLISSGYHLLLFVLVFYFSNIISF